MNNRHDMVSPDLLRTGLNAHRRPQSPLKPPNYAFAQVAKAKKDLSTSVIQEVKDRDHFKECMAEMVLLCNEAIRRNKASRSASKPLSLEYIADRLDVDDPCFGYLARSREGHLQGFITVTTFTNWQKNFRWDSHNECSFYYDNNDDEEDDATDTGTSTTRRIDKDGSLAQELERTVRLGDPYNEGIVWPRIAEVSLLGALGCGKQLVQLAIEQLEFQKPAANANYDYLVLQATDNSIGFYESLGFVRVGAVTFEDETLKENKRPESPSLNSTSSAESSDVAAVAEPLPPTSPEKTDCLARPSNIVSSPLKVHVIQQGGWTPFDVARKYKVNPWDIVFLNRDVYPDIGVKSRLRKGTTLYVPNFPEPKESKKQAPTKWFVAKENDTPRKIAKLHSVACNKLIQANIHRLPELQPASRLKAGTRIKVTNLDQVEEVCQQYCHWSFPDDSSVENGEPSYMMVYKIERKTARAPRVVRDALPKVVPFSTPKLLLDAPPKQQTPPLPVVVKPTRKRPNPPKPPPKPPSGLDVFKDHQKQLYPELRTRQQEEFLLKKWNSLSKYKQGRYEQVAIDCAKHFEAAQEVYQKAYAKWQDDCHNSCAMDIKNNLVNKESSLFCKVVKLRKDAIEGHNYTYWFVLTYIPDLKWCHLAPMVPDGVFGPERKKSQGRTRWRLVDETLGHELDISSMFCIPVRSKALKKTADADKEEWDILDGETPKAPGSITSSSSPQLSDIFSEVATISKREKRSIRKQPVRPRSAIKPMSGKIAIIKPPTEIVASPARSTRSAKSPRSSRSSPKRSSVYSPRRIALKRNHPSDDFLDPARKARKINTVGARRTVLQS
eukprot:scaffold912_cov119-Cylindrotheca_fusiformis.AAC.12